MVEKISEFRRQMEDGTVLVFVPKKAESAVKDSEGQTITMTYATKDSLADGSVTKVGVNTVGGANRPIYLLNGVPTVADKVVTTDEEQEIAGSKKFLGRIFTQGATGSVQGIQNKITSYAIDEYVPSYRDIVQIEGLDKKDNLMGRMIIRLNTSGTNQLITSVNSYNVNDGTTHNVVSKLSCKSDGTGSLSAPTPVSYSADACATLEYLKFTGQNAINVGQNLMHTEGDEDVTGVKRILGNLDRKQIDSLGFGLTDGVSDPNKCWWRMYRKHKYSHASGIIVILMDIQNHLFGTFYLGGYSSSLYGYRYAGNFPVDRLMVASDDTYTYYFVKTLSTSNRVVSWIDNELRHRDNLTVGYDAEMVQEVFTEEEVHALPRYRNPEVVI